jgi:hypothetical protein
MNNKVRLGINIVGRILWAAVGVIGAWGVIAYVQALASYSTSAPQQAALAADSLVWIVGAYAIARGWTEATK